MSDDPSPSVTNLSAPVLLESLPDLFYVVNRDGELVDWNSRLNDVTGYDDAAVASMDPTAFVAADDRSRLAATLARVVATGERESVEVTLVTRRGDHLPYEVTMSPLFTGGERPVGAIGIGRDIGERLAREREFDVQRETLRELTAMDTVLREVNAAVIEADDRTTLERRVCARLVESGAFDGACVGRRHGATDRVRMGAHAGLDGELLEALSSAARETAASRASDTGRLQVVQDVTESDDDPWRHALYGAGFRSYAAVPPRIRGRRLRRPLRLRG